MNFCENVHCAIMDARYRRDFFVLHTGARGTAHGTVHREGENETSYEGHTMYRESRLYSHLLQKMCNTGNTHATQRQP